MVRFQINAEVREYLPDNGERQRKEDKQPCLRPFLSNRKALCSYQATQRKYNHFFCFQLCFSSQKQSISYLFLLYTSQRGIITVILLLFCHFLSHKKIKTHNASNCRKRQKAEENRFSSASLNRYSLIHTEVANKAFICFVLNY